MALLVCNIPSPLAKSLSSRICGTKNQGTFSAAHHKIPKLPLPQMSVTIEPNLHPSLIETFHQLSVQNSNRGFTNFLHFCNELWPSSCDLILSHLLFWLWHMKHIVYFCSGWELNLVGHFSNLFFHHVRAKIFSWEFVVMSPCKWCLLIRLQFDVHHITCLELSIDSPFICSLFHSIAGLAKIMFQWPQHILFC